MKTKMTYERLAALGFEESESTSAKCHWCDCAARWERAGEDTHGNVEWHCYCDAHAEEWVVILERERLEAAAPDLLAAAKAAIGPDSLLGQKAGGECYCNEPDESIGESGTIECDECRARREVKAIRAAIAKAEGRTA